MHMRFRCCGLTLTTSLTALIVLVCGCARTQFQGEPHYPGGVTACHQDCEAQGQRLSAFVFAGEYASSCVCGPNGSDETRDVEAGVAAASVGVVLQMRAAEEQQRQTQQMQAGALQ